MRKVNVMTNPFDPPEDRDQHPENRGDSGGDGFPSYPSYPSYPSTPHPEDAPGFSGSTGYTGHPGYVGYGAADWGGGGQQGGVRAQGTGRVDLMPAVRWAFSVTLRNWKIWMLGALVLVGLSIVGSLAGEMLFGTPAEQLPTEFNPGFESGFSGGALIYQLLLGLVSIVVMIHVYHGALRQVDKQEISLGDFTGGVNLGPALGLYLVIQFVTIVALTPVFVPLIIGGAFAADELSTEDDIFGFLGVVMIMALVAGLVTLLVAPLTQLMIWYVVDRRTTFGGAVREGFRAGLRNYGRLLLFNLVSGILMFLGALFTFGLALVILAPAFLLAQAMIYRQAAGGALPVTP